MQTSLPGNANLGNSATTVTGSVYVLPEEEKNITPSVQSSSNKKKKVMIVEDEADARLVFTQILATVPEFEVLAADDGSDCLAKLEQDKSVDLVLLDIVMPKVDGIDTLKQITTGPEKFGKPTVIMLTNLGGDVAVETAMNLGAKGFLMKIQTDPTMLLEKVKEFLALREKEASEGVSSVDTSTVKAF